MVTQAAEPVEQRLLIRGLDWDRYRRISEALSGRHVRLTYDRGNLEFMTISAAHANLSRLLAQFVIVLTEAFGLPRRSFGDMTCDREDLDRGLEPDECFYITNEPAVRGRDEIDLETVPPPDLMIEIDLSPPGRKRPSIYAALGVPEVWRYDGEALVAATLTSAGRYEPAEFSRCIPSLRPGDLGAFLARRNETDESSLVGEFRRWASSLAQAAGERGRTAE
ncbi:MAG: Uma2 family endonuclease [Planctomycetaceae bacterium]